MLQQIIKGMERLGSISLLKNIRLHKMELDQADFCEADTHGAVDDCCISIIRNPAGCLINYSFSKSTGELSFMTSQNV